MLTQQRNKVLDWISLIFSIYLILYISCINCFYLIIFCGYARRIAHSSNNNFFLFFILLNIIRRYSVCCFGCVFFSLFSSLFLLWLCGCTFLCSRKIINTQVNGRLRLEMHHSMLNLRRNLSFWFIVGWLLSLCESNLAQVIFHMDLLLMIFFSITHNRMIELIDFEICVSCDYWLLFFCSIIDDISKLVNITPIDLFIFFMKKKFTEIWYLWNQHTQSSAQCKASQ